MFTPLNRKVLIEPEPVENKTESGIIIAGEQDYETKRGTVVAIAADVEQAIAVGDTVLFADIDKDEVAGNKVVNEENVIGTWGQDA